MCSVLEPQQELLIQQEQGRAAGATDGTSPWFCHLSQTPPSTCHLPVSRTQKTPDLKRHDVLFVVHTVAPQFQRCGLVLGRGAHTTAHSRAAAARPAEGFGRCHPPDTGGLALLYICSLQQGLNIR